MVLTNDEDIAKKINSAVFPGLQGGPLMHVIAGKAVAFGEALTPEFKTYQQQVKDNAQMLAQTLVDAGLAIVSGGTDNHLMLVDLRPKKITGKAAEAALGRAHITCNKNGIPFDPEKPFVTSGIRLGSPAATSRGFGQSEFKQVGQMIVEVLDGLSAQGRRRQRRDGSRGEGKGSRADREVPDLLRVGRPSPACGEGDREAVGWGSPRICVARSRPRFAGPPSPQAGEGTSAQTCAVPIAVPPTRR